MFNETHLVAVSTSMRISFHINTLIENLVFNYIRTENHLQSYVLFHIYITMQLIVDRYRKLSFNINTLNNIMYFGKKIKSD